MPTDPVVTLNYAVNASGHPRIVQPPTIKVRPGQRIKFVRGSIPTGLTATIRFREPQFFSRETFDEGDPDDITVVAPLTHRTFYTCGLKRNGQLLPDTVSGAANDPSGGGDIEPDPGP